MTTDAARPGVTETRYVPWLARFRRTGGGRAELQLERVGDAAPDARASTAELDALKVATRGVLFEREALRKGAGAPSPT